jgi:hypothetical protein
MLATMNAFITWHWEEAGPAPCMQPCTQPALTLFMRVGRTSSMLLNS